MQSVHAPILYWFPGLTDEGKIPAPFDRRFARGMGRAHHVYGPDGDSSPRARRGLLATPFADGATCVYDGDAQRWTKAQTEPEVWVGVRTDTLPEQLRRRQSLGGVSVTLGDGQRWLIPVCNPQSPRCRLPGYDTLVDGERTRIVDDAYARLAAEAMALGGQVREGLFTDEHYRLEFDDTEWFERIAQIIALNYDITPQEVGALGLLRTAEHYRDVLSAWMDLEAMVELAVIAMAQAREDGTSARLNPTGATPATSPTASGAPTPAATSPPSPTSG